MTGVVKNTVAKFASRSWPLLLRIPRQSLRNLACKRIQADEIWSFCYAKAKNVTEEIAAKNPDAGDVWTWTAMNSESKLMITWRVGGRTTTDAHEFMCDLIGRTSGRVQLTVDGLKHYPPAIVDAYGEDAVDLGIVMKIYSGNAGGRYSPPE